MTDKLFDGFVRNKLESYSSKVPEGLWEKIAITVMPDQPFNDFVRNKLNNHPSSIPEYLWEKIVAEKERRRPFIFWWRNHAALLTVLGLLLLLSGGYFVLKNENKQPITNSTEQVTVQEKKQIDPSEKNLSSNNTGNNVTLVQPDLANNNSNTNSVTPQNDVPVMPSTTNTIAANFSQPGWNVSRGIIAKRPFLTDGTLPFVTNNNASQSSDQNSNQGNSIVDEVFNLSPKRNTQSILFSSPGVYNINNELTFQLKGTPKDCPSARGNERNDVYFELYGSPDYAMKSVSSFGLSDAYLQQKDSSESLRGGFTVGARISRNIGEHLLLKGGIQYSQINELFSKRSISETRTTTVIVARTITRPQGDTTISDTTTLTQIGYSIKTSHNQYKNIEIPLIAGYEFGKQNDKWRAAVNGGVIINATSWFSGETLDTSGNVVPINAKSGTGVIYKHNVGLSLYGSVSLTRKVSDNLDIYAEPYFRYSLSNMSSDVGFNQRFSAVGLSVGTRIRLNGHKQH